MSIINLAKSSSVFKGYEYYKEKKVISWAKISDTVYEGKVQGTENKIYDVSLNLEKIRQSSCNCPLADGTRKICKHMVALFFTIFPDEAKMYVHRQQEEYNKIKKHIKEMENESNKKKREIEKYVNSLPERTIKNMLIDYLLKDDDTYTQEDYDYYYDHENYYSYFEKEESYFEKKGKLLLSVVVEGFERISEHNTIFININNNEIIEVSEDENTECYIAKTNNVLNNMNEHIILPAQKELNNYEIMIDFIEKLENKEYQRHLYKSISGQSPFKKFKNALKSLELKEEWVEFKRLTYIEKAKEFLFDNFIHYINDLEY